MILGQAATWPHLLQWDVLCLDFRLRKCRSSNEKAVASELLDQESEDVALSTGNEQPRMNIQEQFGQIDIYVFDQILRGNIGKGMRVLDAGCGYGRNLVHLLREGCEVFAMDADASGS